MKTFLVLIALTVSQFAFANPNHPSPTMPKNFDMMKSLTGTWEGTTQMHGKEQMTTMTYELTANGTAIKETMMPNTPQEMLTMYYAEGNQVTMTHYCAMGNHPKLTMKKADPTMMQFELAPSNNGLKSKKEPHMHALTITMMSPDQMKQEWTSFENGKKKEVTTFTLNRKK
jgi:hypothetical protein